MNKLVILTSLLFVGIVLSLSIHFLLNTKDNSEEEQEVSEETVAQVEHLSAEVDSAVVHAPVVSADNLLSGREENEMYNEDQVAYLIGEAKKIVLKGNVETEGIEPRLAVEESYISVYWPIPIDADEVPVLGPAIAVAVYFDKETFEPLGALGPH